MMMTMITMRGQQEARVFCKKKNLEGVEEKHK